MNNSIVRGGGLLFEGEAVSEAREEAECFGFSGLIFLFTVFADHLQLDGHEHSTRLFGLRRRPLPCLGLPHRPLPPLCHPVPGPGLGLEGGLEQTTKEPAPARSRILFLILAGLLLLLFRRGGLHLGGFGGRRGALWGSGERRGEQGRRVT